MNPITTSEIKVVSTVKTVNEMINKNWSVLEIFLKGGEIVYVLGYDVRNCKRVQNTLKRRKTAR
ncbi:MAG: hypothetical protein K0Q87_4884 [Neobacillus sp.]|jgi:hypothetical protein|nr:hypothetical protein [Neobacillus sp.]